MIQSMHHAGFVVDDIEMMRDFYRDVIGLTVMWERRGIPEFTSVLMAIQGAQTRAVMLETPGGAQRLELLKFETPSRSDKHSQEIGLGTAHVCFQVNDLAAMYATLRENDARVVHPPIERQMDIGYIKACYARDPEGNWLEFLEIDTSSASI